MPATANSQTLCTSAVSDRAPVCIMASDRTGDGFQNQIFSRGRISRTLSHATSDIGRPHQKKSFSWPYRLALRGEMPAALARPRFTAYDRALLRGLDDSCLCITGVLMTAAGDLLFGKFISLPSLCCVRQGGGTDFRGRHKHGSLCAS